MNKKIICTGIISIFFLMFMNTVSASEIPTISGPEEENLWRIGYQLSGGTEFIVTVNEVDLKEYLEEYEESFSSYQIKIDFGDGKSDWLGPYILNGRNAEKLSFKHIYDRHDDREGYPYKVKARGTDSSMETEWSKTGTISIMERTSLNKMPKSGFFNSLTLLQTLLNKFLKI